MAHERTPVSLWEHSQIDSTAFMSDTPKAVQQSLSPGPLKAVTLAYESISDDNIKSITTFPSCIGQNILELDIEFADWEVRMRESTRRQLPLSFLTSCCKQSSDVIPGSRRRHCHGSLSGFRALETLFLCAAHSGSLPSTSLTNPLRAHGTSPLSSPSSRHTLDVGWSSSLSASECTV